jgi:hypothetical protein
VSVCTLSWLGPLIPLTLSMDSLICLELVCVDSRHITFFGLLSCYSESLLASFSHSPSPYFELLDSRANKGIFLTLSPIAPLD